MDTYLHRLFGLYSTRQAADAVRDLLVRNGIAPERVKVHEPGQDRDTGDTTADSDDVLHEMLRVGALGTAAGALAGAAGTMAFAAANVSLFIASPVIGTLAMMGWGASAGGLLGAAFGADSRKGEIADLVRDTLASGHVVLVAYTGNEAETTRAQRIIGESMSWETGDPPRPAALQDRA